MTNLDNEIRINKLISSLQNLMESEKLYLQPKLNRKALAAKLNTNERYLADAIQIVIGVTVSAFINQYRLKHSMDLLISNSLMKIEDVAIESGFTSRVSYFRVFIREYGFSPTDFRYNYFEGKRK